MTVKQSYPNTRVAPWGLELQPTDVLLLGAMGIFSLLAGMFHTRVDGWISLLLLNAALTLIYLILVWMTQKTTRPWPKFLLRTASVQLLFVYMFGMVHALQLIFSNTWNDPSVLNFEYALFGFHPILELQPYISPLLTEWLMFSYVVYIPIYPVLAGIIFFKRGESELEDFLFTLALVNMACNIGFILFPVAGPRFTISHLYKVPLDGYFFTWIGELIRNNMHPMGGTIPSPHGAVATIMWLMAYRYHRPSFTVLTPIILSLYVSTFYCRYHYVTDIIVGIIVALLVFWISPYLQKMVRPAGRMIQLQET
jgi:membrane-associated phospholipid phosphatase